MLRTQCILLISIWIIESKAISTFTAQSSCRIFNDSHYGGLFADCSSRNMNSIPEDIPSIVVAIDLSNNKLREVDNYSFEGKKSLTFLTLSQNQIHHLEVNAFLDCTNLKTLDLSSNELHLTYSSYPEAVFLPLVNLNFLNLAGNEIESSGTYPDKIFKPLVNLHTLMIDTFEKAVFGEGFQCLKSLEILHFDNRPCHLFEVTNETFEVFASSRLQKLFLSGCSLHKLETGAFTPLQSLHTIDMSHTSPVGVHEALASLSAFKGRMMRMVNFKSVKKSREHRTIDDIILKSEVLKPLSELCILHLNLARNDILVFKFKALVNSVFSSCIQHLDLSYNQIEGSPLELFQIDSFENMTFFDFSFQEYAIVRHSKVDGLLKYTDLITNVKNWTLSISAPPKLRALNFSTSFGNLGKISLNYNFVNATNLRELNLSYIGLREFMGTVTGLTALENFDLSGNDCSSMSYAFFDTFPELARLSLSNVKLNQDFIMTHGKRLLKYLTELTELDISYNSLMVIPTGMFKGATKLRILNLSGNRFITVPFHLQNPSLTLLDLSSNAISALDRDTQNILDEYSENVKNFHLKLHNNMFSCVCNTFGFIQWLEETKVNLDNGHNYTCISEQGGLANTAQVGINLDLFWRSCVSRLWLSFAVSTLAVLISTFFCTLLIMKHKTKILHFFLNIFGNPIQLQRRQDFDYDVYVVYADADYQWACHSVRTNLEVARNLRLLLPDRDILPGQDRAEEIVDSINKSLRTIIILSEAFLQDDWSHFTMKAAVYAICNENPNRVVVLVEEPGNLRIPEYLLNSVEEENIISFCKFIEDDNIFWGELYKRILQEK